MYKVDFHKEWKTDRQILVRELKEIDPLAFHCRPARSFLEFTTNLLGSGLNELTLEELSQMKVMLVDKYFEYRIFCQHPHRDFAGDDRHICLYTVFVEAYDEIKAVEESKNPPQVVKPDELPSRPKWQQTPLIIEIPPHLSKNDPRSDCCDLSLLLSLWLEYIMRVLKRPSLWELNQAKILVVDKYFEVRSSADIEHRDCMGEADHTCIYHVFVDAYIKLQRANLALTAPLEKLQPRALLDPRSSMSDEYNTAGTWIVGLVEENNE